ncbi:MAG TPA: hypothetical protein VNS81_06580 [Nocardioides sp.]|nr:hypothetical protein [Nocardioides sp.]
MGVKVTGLRETVRELEKIGVEIDDLKDGMARIAAKATQVMQGFIPSRSGKLRASARGNRAKGKAVVTIGRASVPYAAPINYGWPRRNIAPAAFTAKTDAVMDRLAPQMLDDEIDNILRRTK